MPNRYQLLYLSRLVPEVSPTCVAEIVRGARMLNASRHIGSLLVFDGWRFCQYLEGETAEVIALAERIRMDARHTDFRLLHQAAFDGSSLLADPGLDYALSYEDSLEGFEKISGTEALALLKTLLPEFDRAP